MQAHVYRAACRTIIGATKQEPLCDSVHAAGQCEPGTKLDLVCRDQTNKAAHKTRCVYIGATANNTKAVSACKCDAGYANPKSGADEVTDDNVCADVNECLATTPPCAGVVAGNNTNQGARSACQNTEGFYRCLTTLAQECSSDQNYGGCWRGPQGDTGAACLDNLAAFQAAAANGAAGAQLPPLHQCDCAAVEGCWRGSGTTCTAACSSDECQDGECGTSGAPSVCPLLAVQSSRARSWACRLCSRAWQTQRAVQLFFLSDGRTRTYESWAEHSGVLYS